MTELSPAEKAVEKSLESMTQTLRDLTGNLTALKDDVDDKLDDIKEDVGGLRQTLAEMAVENRHWVGREDFVRLEGDLKAAAIKEARDEVEAEAAIRKDADDRLEKRFWYLLGLIVTVAIGLAVEYLKKGGGP